MDPLWKSGVGKNTSFLLSQYKNNIWRSFFFSKTTFYMIKSSHIKNRLCSQISGNMVSRAHLWKKQFYQDNKINCISACGWEDEPWFVLIPVSVGYEYESCLDLTLWEKRTAILQGYELDASNMGGWTLNKHHVLDVQNGKSLSTDS